MPFPKSYLNYMSVKLGICTTVILKAEMPSVRERFVVTSSSTPPGSLGSLFKFYVLSPRFTHFFGPQILLDFALVSCLVSLGK